MSFDKDLIFVYCQPISNLFCGAVYCVVGQTGRVPPGFQSLNYENKQGLQRVEPHIEELEEEGNLIVYTEIITPTRINMLGLGIDGLIQQRLRRLTWQFIYNQKIKQPKVKLCVACGRFDEEDIEFVSDTYPEEKVIMAIAYLKRHSLIDTHYSAAYPDCDLQNNYGVMNLDSLFTIKKAEYRNNFFLRPSIYLKLPELLIEAFQYVPDPKSSRRCFSYLTNPKTFRLPRWWDLVQEAEHEDLTTSKRFLAQKQLAIQGQQDRLFRIWLEGTYPAATNQY